MLVKEIMSPNVAFVTDKNTLQEAAEKMQTLDVGELPIVIGRTAVGIITDRDIAIRGVAHGLDPRVTKVVDSMSEGVTACRESDTIEEAARIMGANRIRRLPVMDAEGRMSGMVSLGDMAQRLSSGDAGKVLAEISR